MTETLISFGTKNEEKDFLDVFLKVLDFSSLSNELILQFKEEKLKIESTISQTHALRVKFPEECFQTLDSDKKVKVERQTLADVLKLLQSTREHSDKYIFLDDGHQILIDYQRDQDPMKFRKNGIEERETPYHLPLVDLSVEADSFNPDSLEALIDSAKDYLDGEEFEFIISTNNITFSIGEDEDKAQGRLPPIDASADTETEIKTKLRDSTIAPLKEFINLDILEDMSIKTGSEHGSNIMAIFEYESDIEIEILLAPIAR